MNYLELNNKKLPIPSFFQVYNFGGGNGDKDREIVYAELTDDTPALVNYHYINNRFPHLFQSKLFDNISSHKSVGDLYNFIRTKLIEKGEIYSEYPGVDFDFNKKVFLLDSGAFNIIKYLAENANYDILTFNSRIDEEVVSYYDFAHSLKFDIVVCFDMGGKYTEKDVEKSNKKLNDFLAQIDTERFNNHLLEITAKYLKTHSDYYPKMLATVHGNTPTKYEECTRSILELENKYDIRFWGFALGGIASYKQVDASWYNDIDLSKFGKRDFISAITPARACKIVRNLVGNRPIHALGCGGYNNIPLNYYCGATSFDAASPVRRVGDGNLASTKIVFDPTPSKEGFSKYFVGGINSDDTLRSEAPKYIKLNEVSDNMPLCGCAACQQAESVYNLKKLYSMKAQNPEANYYSRQLIGLHAVYQHRKLCETIRKYDSIASFASSYRNKFTTALKCIYTHL